MHLIEVILFVSAVVGVIGLGFWKSKREAGASGYFLAGRGLTWWLVGFSLIAANISTEQFVGMSGSSANWLGMAIAPYGWVAAVTLVVVAFWFLPKFLRSGIYTLSEFLEYRFGAVARMTTAIPAVVTLVFVATSSVIFSGAKFVSSYYHDFPLLNSLTVCCWGIAVYVYIGGLRACAWTDLVWGSALIAGGVVVAVLAFNSLSERSAEALINTKVANSTATVEDLANAGAWELFVLLNDGRNGEAEVQSGPVELHCSPPSPRAASTSSASTSNTTAVRCCRLPSIGASSKSFAMRSTYTDRSSALPSFNISEFSEEAADVVAEGCRGTSLRSPRPPVKSANPISISPCTLC